jgi:hypothetical protein
MADAFAYSADTAKPPGGTIRRRPGSRRTHGCEGATADERTSLAGLARVATFTDREGTTYAATLAAPCSSSAGHRR